MKNRVVTTHKAARYVFVGEEGEERVFEGKFELGTGGIGLHLSGLLQSTKGVS
jgi:hypothetical protein